MELTEKSDMVRQFYPRNARVLDSTRGALLRVRKHSIFLDGCGSGGLADPPPRRLFKVTSIAESTSEQAHGGIMCFQMALHACAVLPPETKTSKNTMFKSEYLF
ncbi:hypothetical protein Ancab_034447 [Ancistrocladus abbreviatus]